MAGAWLGFTWPLIFTVASAKPGAMAAAVIEIWDEVPRGVQVAAYVPADPEIGARGNGGSPFEKVAETCPLVTGVPQLSFRLIETSEGHDAGVEKFVAGPTGDTTSCDAVHPVAAGLASPSPF
jgi:hypothetical protein